ncbi:porin family protein [Marixanthomonas spongiae]|uniref:Outer membrane channel superfamily protein n=1 Tax=Marixanthomonas spongiae TaxID=2174845 RepID=A0A2U0I3J9_9FLAO|nr:porin family protein [Marixanthomonas spongiae]PVW15687.1 outer membrane channel superfamily protein [Marixanthomonas spongiae]
MKKLIFAVLALVTITTTQAQNIDLGIKAGVNFANVSDVSDFDSKTGFVAGAFVGFKLSDNLGLQADLLYSQQGAEFDAGKFDFDYINVPIIAKIYLMKGLNLQVGPQFGFVVDKKTEFDLIDFSELPDFEDSDVSGVIGAGYDFPLGIRVDARYNFGFNDLGKDDAFEVGKNRVFTISLGYSFL